MKRANASLSRLMTCVLAAVLVLAAVVPASAFAADILVFPLTEVDPNYVPPPVYTCGDYSYYFNDDEETVTIADYNGTEKDIVIPTELDGHAVTRIGMQAFSYVKMNSLGARIKIVQNKVRYSVGYALYYIRQGGTHNVQTNQAAQPAVQTGCRQVCSGAS